MTYKPTRTYMKRQHLDGYDLYTPQPSNDWIGTILSLILGIMLAGLIGLVLGALSVLI